MVPENVFSEETVERMRKLIGGPALPGIARRAEKGEMPEGCVALGFSSPFRVDGQRVRIAGYVLKEQIEKVATPYEVFEAGLAGCGGLSEILRCISRFNDKCRIGVWGAAAQEIAGGVKCMDAASDIDLLVQGFSLDRLRDFRSWIDEIEAEFQFDIEVVLRNSGGVKIDELLADGKTCLVKKIDGVDVVPRREVYALLG